MKLSFRLSYKCVEVLIVYLILVIIFSVASSSSYAAISFRASSTSGGAAGVTSISLNMPSGTVQGDVMIAAIQWDGNNTATTITPPVGWALIQNINNTSGYNLHTAAFYKIAGSSEAGPYSFGFSSSVYGTGAIITYTGVDSSGPIDVSNGQTQGLSTATTTTFNTPSITTTRSNDMLIAVFGAATSIGSWGLPSGMTQRLNAAYTGSGERIGVFEQLQAATGSVSKSSNLSTSSYGGTVFFALKEQLPVSTTGSQTVTHNSFYANGTVTNSSTQPATYGVAWGAGSGYSTTGCSSLPNKSDGGTVSANIINQSVSSFVSGLSSSTIHYFCVYLRDSNNAYYYSSNTLSVTTTSPPAPGLAYPQSSAIDDNSAILGAGVDTVGLTATAIIRYGTSNVACGSLPSVFPSSGSIPITTVGGYYYANSVRVTGLVAGQTYYWCMVATNSSGGVGNSGVQTFQTAASASTGCDLLPGSTLANSTNKTTLAGYLGSSKLKGTLLYRATVNGWTPANFHTAVDGQGENIVIFKNQGNNAIFGGYAPQSWSSSVSMYLTGSNAFLFSFTENYKLNQLNAQNQLYTQNTWGPYFGGNNLYDINNPMSSGAYTNSLGNYYEAPSTKGSPNFLNGTSVSPNFTPSEIEVYKISVCTSSAPTITTPTKTSITGTTATLGGNITSAGTQSITERGIVYSPTSVDSDPRLGEAGVIKVVDPGGTTTGTFTVSATGLQPNTAYSFNAYATNSVGTGYVSDTFTTPTTAPMSVSVTTTAAQGSYFATLTGSANPNGSTTTVHFRVFKTNPGNCNNSTDVEGMTNIRFPALSRDDISIGSSSTSQAFSYVIPKDSAAYLTPNTQYWHCAYATNGNGTTGAAVPQTFNTANGPASPCDPPTNLSLSIDANSACTFYGPINGVDTGTADERGAVGTLTLKSNVDLTINLGQKIAYGDIDFSDDDGYARIIFAQGVDYASQGELYVHDSDGDGYLDADKIQYIGPYTSTPSGGFFRRSKVKDIYDHHWKTVNGGATVDCDSNNPYVYRRAPQAVVVDSDNDGYKTAAASDSSACVGNVKIISGRAYYNDTTNNYKWLVASQVLGSGATDCQDNPNGTPCAPASVTASNVSSSSNNVSWSGVDIGGDVPAATGYDLKYCTGSGCAPATVIQNVTSTYLHSGLSSSQIYRYAIAAKNANGVGAYSTSIAQASTGAPCVNGYQDNDSDGIAAGAFGCYTGVVVGSAVTGTKISQNVGTVTTDATVGTGNWTNATVSYLNSADSKGSYSQLNQNQVTKYLKLTNFGFSLPTDAVITGIRVDVRKSGGTFSSIQDNSIKIVKGGVISGTEKSTGSTWPTSLSYTTYGGSGDLWGSTWTYGDINSTGFGVVISAKSTGSLTVNSNIDNVRIRVYYTSSSSPVYDPNDNDLNCQVNMTGLFRDNDGDGYTTGSTTTVCVGSGASAANVGYQNAASSTSDCNDNNSVAWQNLSCYVDADNDGFNPSNATIQSACTGSTCSYGWTTTKSSPADCYDLNANAYPDGTNYSSSTRGSVADSAGNSGNSYDYNCDGSNTKYSMYDCTAALGCTISQCYAGFSGSIPACGQTGLFTTITAPDASNSCQMGSSNYCYQYLSQAACSGSMTTNSSSIAMPCN